MSSTGTLSAAASDRKARLAQLKNLKRKAPSDSNDDDAAPAEAEPTDSVSAASTILSGRNYDALTRGPKLGFELNPIAQSTTLTAEARAAALADEARLQREAEEAKAAEAAPLDLFALQPKKANWDLKRELERRMEESGLNLRTDNAVARLVRERVEAQKKAARTVGDGGGEGEETGMEGSALVEATRERQKEDEEESRRERELDADLEAP
ncbi:hypothetical protein ANO11243_009030 [Dothideomycetidae sp. 11243]|nr:hypothetical protein ANO11243_009030 [fungal sp. No.11243]